MTKYWTRKTDFNGENLEDKSELSWKEIVPLSRYDDETNSNYQLIELHFSHGNYVQECNSCDIANHRYFVKEFSKENSIFWWHVSDRDSKAIATVPYENMPKQMQEFFAALENHPVISDDLLTEIEQELTEEAWETFYRNEIRYELQKTAWQNESENDAFIDYIERLNDDFYDELRCKFEQGKNCEVWENYRDEMRLTQSIQNLMVERFYKYAMRLWNREKR